MDFLNFSPKFVDVGKVILYPCIAFLIYNFIKYAQRRRIYSNILPGNTFWFFDVLGDAKHMFYKTGVTEWYSFNVLMFQIAGAYTKIFKEHQLFVFWLTYFPCIMMTKAEAVEAVISGTQMMEKAFVYKFLHPWLGTGLLTSHGGKWKSRRKLLTPAFHFDILKDFLPVFNEQAQKLVNRLRKETNKEYTEIGPLVTLCSLDIICETTLGVSVNAQENSESEYIKAVSRTSEIIMERMINCLRWPKFIFSFTQNGKKLEHDLKLLHDFTRSVIQEKKKKLLNREDSTASTQKRKALMDVLLEHHMDTKNLSEEDIREEVDTFAFEGHDTTSMGMTWVLYLLGLNQDIQEKVFEELDSIFGDDVDRPVTTEDLKDLKYLDCVLKESQRLYPSVPAIARQVTEDDNICGYKIPKGAVCIISPYYLHRNEDVFPNPEKFDPDRFLPENSTNRHPYAYIPFSAGPRNCIGQRFALMEEKVVVSTILRNFTLHSLDPRDKIVVSPELTLRPVTSLKIRIRPRNLTTM